MCHEVYNLDYLEKTGIPNLKKNGKIKTDIQLGEKFTTIMDPFIEISLCVSHDITLR